MLKHIFKILLGNGAAQLIQFSSLFLLARLYSPSEFSVLAIVQSIATFFAIAYTLQLHHVLPIVSDEDERYLTYSAIVFQILLLLLLYSMAMSFFGFSIYMLGVILGGVLAFYNTNISLLSARRKFGYISIVYIIRAILIVVFQISFSFLDFIERLAVSIIFAEFFVQILFLKNFKFITIKFKKVRIKLIELYKQRTDFCIYGSLQEIIAAGAFFLPLYFIEYRFGEDASGNYGMASRLVWAPAVLLSSSFAQVLYSKLGAMEERFAYEFVRDINFSPYIFLGILIGIACFYLDPLYYLILGNEWSLAINMIPIIILWAMVFILGTIFRILYRVFSIQKKLLIVDLLFMVLVVVIFLFFPNINVLTSLWLIFGASTISTMITVAVLMSIASKRFG